MARRHKDFRADGLAYIVKCLVLRSSMHALVAWWRWIQLQLQSVASSRHHSIDVLAVDRRHKNISAMQDPDFMNSDN